MIPSVGLKIGIQEKSSPRPTEVLAVASGWSA